MFQRNPLEGLNRKHYLLIVVLLLINVAQALFTGLHTDEGYYWLYSQKLAWGYFDHPPMVALVIHLGDLITHNQLGVRLFTILLSTITTILIIKETKEKTDIWFLALFLLSFPLFHTHIGGFLSLPDIPLVFFTLLFFLTYRHFLEKADLKLSILLGLLTAAMIYSKYHAFLIIGLTVLSNLKLLKNKYFWLSVFIAILILAPHFWWQFDNNFPSFRYHLHDRTKPFQLKYAIDNILNQLVILGPLTFPIIILGLTRFKIKGSLFNRSLLFNIVGFFIVLFVLSFKNRIEAHWTVAITPLIMIATYPQIANNANTKRWFKRLALPMVILLLCFRFYIAADFIPQVGKSKSAFYKRAESSAQIKSMAKNTQVASFNNFAFPGIYEFYTGDKALHLATPDYRFCQFDLTQDEKSFDDDSLFIIVPDRMNPSQLIKLTNGKKIDTLRVSDFQSLKKMTISASEISKNDTLLYIHLKLINKSGKTIWFNHPSNPAIGFMQNKRELQTIPLQNYGREIGNNNELEIPVSIPLQQIDSKHPLIIYSKTAEENRGELISIEIPIF